VQTRRFFAAVLREILANDAVIDDTLIDRYWKLNNREGAAAAAEAFTKAQYQFWDTTDVGTYYGRLRRPDLLAFFGPLHAWKIAPDGSVNDNVLLNSTGVS
jgi:hypothetical protein